MWQWRNFENRAIFDEVICRLRWLTFFGPPCIWIMESSARALGLYCSHATDEPVLQYNFTLRCNSSITATWRARRPLTHIDLDWMRIVLMKAGMRRVWWWSMSVSSSCRRRTGLSSMTRWRSCSSQGYSRRSSPLSTWRPNSGDLSSRKPRRRSSSRSGMDFLALTTQSSSFIRTKWNKV